MRIFQLCARLEFGDAVSNHVFQIDKTLSSWGLDTMMFSEARDVYFSNLAKDDAEYTQFVKNPEDILIYHYSVFCSNYEMYLESKNRKIFIYHNITPPEYLDPFGPGVGEICRRGRELLPELAECDLALGDSEYNRRELVDMGFDSDRTGVLPIFVNYERLLKPRLDFDPMAPFANTFNILFVGRKVPNKRLDDVIRAFFYYHRCINSQSHLFLVGPSWFTQYDGQLQWLVDSYQIWDNIHFIERVSDAELASYYRGADVYLSMSDHEGFAVPLIESFAVDLPALAYGSTAIPFTMDGAGLMFLEKDFPMIGELMELLRQDSEFRDSIIKGQRERLEDFSPQAVSRELKKHLRKFVELPD